ncbi:MAG: class I SAM-dependent methyltransferase [candidate division Zixibacteria bacterium]|nr:class I SAM-dependent methyltransferase [candidate division Zixibacteria bacterium]
METKFKISLQGLLQSGKPVILELGCGNTKAPGSIGIDKLDLPAVDIVTDVERGLPFFPDNSVDQIHSKSFLEHLDNFERVMGEMVRILKTNGRCRLYLPHFSNPYYYSDYTHRRFFGLYTFCYFTDEKNQLKRKVPSFYTNIRIKILSHKLVFTSPFIGRNLLKKLFEVLFNLNRGTQEFYEENLCWIFPCYALEIEFTPDK